MFKTIADRHVGQISLLSSSPATLRSRRHLVNPRSGADERLHGLFALRGREHLDVGAAPAGDIVAVAKLSGTATGDTLAPKGTPVRVPTAAPAEPVLAVAVVARTQTDDDKLANALHRLVEEDPALVVDRDDETHQTLLRGMGETHLQITLERLERKFGVAVDQQEVRVAYRETVPGSADGRGEVQEAERRARAVRGGRASHRAPRTWAAASSFVDQIVGGAIPRQFIPAVEKGIVEAMAEGGCTATRWWTSGCSAPMASTTRWTPRR